MGATDFHTCAFGKDARDAFRSATEEARHAEGHGGYTGTIAEKSDFAEVELPKGLKASTVEKIIDAAMQYRAAGDEDWQNGKYVTLKKSNVPSALRKYEGVIARLGRIADDKWGPAACVKAPASVEKRYRKRNGLQRKAGGVFVFFGLASD